MRKSFKQFQPFANRMELFTFEDRNPPSDWLQSWLAGSHYDAPAIPASEDTLTVRSEYAAPKSRGPAMLPLANRPEAYASAQSRISKSTPAANAVEELPEIPLTQLLRPSLDAIPLFTPAQSAAPGASVAAPVLVHAEQGPSQIAVSSDEPLQAPTARSATPIVAPAEVLAATTVKPEGTVEMAFTQTEILIGFRGEGAVTSLTASLPGLFTAEGSRVMLTHDGVSVVELKLQPGIEPKAAVSAAEKLPGVAWAEVNHVMAQGTGRDFTPNDTQYSSQFHHTKSQTDLAWNIQTGSSSIMAADADDGVGINHPDLINNIYTNALEASGAPGTDDDGNGYIDDLHGWDVNQNDGDPLPSGENSHGTHVSGIIAAEADNGIGVAGVAGGGNGKGSGVRILPIRWDGEAGWSATDIIEAYTYATDSGAKLINSSYNFDGFAADNSVIAAFNYGYSKGVLFFNSAGNNNQLDAARGVLTQCLFVSSLDSADVKSSFSNYGAYVDIAAHGSGILSTTTNTNGTGVNYEFYDGTSMSTPHALGAAALIWSQNPTWTREQVVARLLATADSVATANPAFPGALGSGRINPNRALTETNPAPKFGPVTGLPTGLGGNVSSFSITTTMRLDPASVVAGNFELRGDGADGAFDTADDVLLPFTINAGAAYRVGTNALTFTPTAPGNLPPDRYRFTGFSSAGKLRDPFGTALDGDANGTGGDNFVRIFNTAPSIGGRTYEDSNGNGLRNGNDTALSARTVFLDTNGNGTLDTGGGTYNQTTPLNINDVSTQTSNLIVSGLAGNVGDVNVTLDITHTYDADLDIFLITPTGTRIELSTDNGGNGKNFTGTTFDDEATTLITAGVAPFTASFKPEGLLSAADGQNGNGTWGLEITDDAGTDFGVLNNWSLTIQTSAEPNLITDANGDYSFYGLAAGSYSVRQVLPTGWTRTSPASIPVTLATGSSNATGIDLGSAKNNRFYGSAFSDFNSNGVRDGVDAGIAGRVIFDDLNGNSTLDGPVNSDITNSTPMTINDVSTQTSNTVVSGLSGTIADLDVTISLTHSYNSDLDIFLVAPNGARIELSTDNGGSGDNFLNLRFDDEALASVTTITGNNVTGSVKSETALSAIDGISPNGTWGLEITDDAGTDTGELSSWTLNISAGTGIEPSATTNAPGNAPFDLANGNHTFRILPANGTTLTAPVSGSYAVTANGTAPLTSPGFGVRTGAAPLANSFAFTSPQRSRIFSTTVSFSESVSYFNDGTANNGFVFTVTPVGGGTPVNVIPIVSWNGTQTVATLTFPAGMPSYRSLPEGRFSLSVLAANLRDADGNFPIANTPFTSASFYRLFGDCDANGASNGTVGADDFAAFGSVVGQNVVNSPFDFDDNNTIDANDFAAFGGRFGVTI